MVIELFLLSIFLFIGAMASVFFSCDIPVSLTPFIVTTLFRQPSWRLRSSGHPILDFLFLCSISPFSDLPLIFFEGRMVLRISCVMYAMGFSFLSLPFFADASMCQFDLFYRFVLCSSVCPHFPCSLLCFVSRVTYPRSASVTCTYGFILTCTNRGGFSKLPTLFVAQEIEINIINKVLSGIQFWLPISTDLLPSQVTRTRDLFSRP